ncbi:hypothetical protein AX17_002192 [Amanita inopinata Kibby_2008]|nr:hypothetical protein AX17_002192 [Amanita inopinata Kibby_2008]
MPFPIRLPASDGQQDRLYKLALTVRYRGLKATQYFSKWSQAAVKQFKDDLVILKYPLPKADNVGFITHGCMEAVWIAPLDSQVHRTLEAAVYNQKKNGMDVVAFSSSQRKRLDKLEIDWVSLDYYWPTAQEELSRIVSGPSSSYQPAFQPASTMSIDNRLTSSQLSQRQPPPNTPNRSGSQIFSTPSNARTQKQKQQAQAQQQSPQAHARLQPQPQAQGTLSQPGDQPHLLQTPALRAPQQRQTPITKPLPIKPTRRQQSTSSAGGSSAGVANTQNQTWKLKEQAVPEKGVTATQGRQPVIQTQAQSLPQKQLQRTQVSSQPGQKALPQTQLQQSSPGLSESAAGANRQSSRPVPAKRPAPGTTQGLERVQSPGSGANKRAKLEPPATQNISTATQAQLPAQEQDWGQNRDVNQSSTQESYEDAMEIPGLSHVRPQPLPQPQGVSSPQKQAQARVQPRSLAQRLSVSLQQQLEATQGQSPQVQAELQLQQGNKRAYPHGGEVASRPNVGSSAPQAQPQTQQQVRVLSQQVQNQSQNQPQLEEQAQSSRPAKRAKLEHFETSEAEGQPPGLNRVDKSLDTNALTSIDTAEANGTEKAGTDSVSVDPVIPKTEPITTPLPTTVQDRGAGSGRKEPNVAGLRQRIGLSNPQQQENQLLAERQALMLQFESQISAVRQDLSNVMQREIQIYDHMLLIQPFYNGPKCVMTTLNELKTRAVELESEMKDLRSMREQAEGALMNERKKREETETTLAMERKRWLEVEETVAGRHQETKDVGNDGSRIREGSEGKSEHIERVERIKSFLREQAAREQVLSNARINERKAREQIGEELGKEKRMREELEELLRSERGMCEELEMVLKNERNKRAELEMELAKERKERDEAEDALRDIERECRTPFVIPALLEAFTTVSKLTSRVMDIDS